MAYRGQREMLKSPLLLKLTHDRMLLLLLLLIKMLRSKKCLLLIKFFRRAILNDLLRALAFVVHTTDFQLVSDTQWNKENSGKFHF